MSPNHIIFLLIFFFIIPLISQIISKIKSQSKFSKTLEFFSRNLKLTYIENDLSYDTEANNSFLSLILKKYKEINDKKIINKCKFSLLKFYLLEISVLLPCLCTANLYFKFVKMDIIFSLLSLPFAALCIFPFYIYIRFVQPRETWTRHSKIAALLETEFYSYIYHRGIYQTIAFSPLQISTFENRILDIFSKNIANFSENMKKHTEADNSFKNIKL